ncbi:MAG TPA: YceD family protein [Gammaproteobacteria bacterium]|nr:YceD family protein [Gammaproteobacteria bacterium]
MSGSLHVWYGLRDLETLGKRQVTLDGELPLRKLTRLAELLHHPDGDAGGSVEASLRFEQRRDGWLALTLDYDTTVELTCQRCLEPFRERISDRVALVIAESEPPPSAAPEGFESVELDDGRLLPAQLIEDELIVSIPLVPKHARIEDCGSLARALTTSTPKPDGIRETEPRSVDTE